MAVNLAKNKDSMKKAWADIIDDNKLAKWAVFSYEGKTFDLQLSGTGDGDLQEMVDEFNSGKIMYAVCRVIDPKTSLPKFVLINWQGEGAPGDRKGKCANHIRDVGDFFKGVHITINARTEDDVDPNIILEKVSKATGSAYSFKDRAGPLENHTPVGSVYKRIVPTAEINSKERDKFWEKQELEEKHRLEEERKKANQASSQLETERTKREIQDAQRREEFVKQRTKIINEIRTAEKVTTKNIVESEKKRWEKQVEEDAEENEKRLKNNEHKRLERNQEVESLIGQRTLNARAIFEQNTVAGQMSSMRTSVEKLPSSNGKSYSSQDSDSSSSLSVTSGKPFSPTQTPPSPEPEFAAVCSNRVFSNVDTSHYAASRVVLGDSPEPTKPSRTPNISESERINSPQEATSQVFLSNNEQTDATKDNSDNEVVAQYVYTNDGNLDQDNQPTLIVRALYDYQAADDTEISFNPDDIITHVDRIDEGWWQGLAPDGIYGLFPANYVEIIE